MSMPKNCACKDEDSFDVCGICLKRDWDSAPFILALDRLNEAPSDVQKLLVTHRLKQAIRAAQKEHISGSVSEAAWHKIAAACNEFSGGLISFDLINGWSSDHWRD